MKKKAYRNSFIKQFYKGNIGRLLLGVLYTVLIAAANLVISWLLQQIIDVASGTDTGFSFEQLIMIAVGGIALFVVAYTVNYFSRPRFIAKASQQYKNYVYSELAKKDIAAFSKESTSLYISALSNDINTIETGYLNMIFELITGVLFFASSIAMMLWYSPTLTLVSVGVLLLPIASALLAGDKVAKAEKLVSDKNEGYMSTLRDSLVGFSVVKSFKAELQMCRLFAEDVKSVSDAKCKKSKMTILVEGLSIVGSTITQIVVFIVSAYLAIKGEITIGVVIIFVQLMNYVVGPISALPQAIAEMKASLSLVDKIANALSENVRDEGKAIPNKLEKGISIKNLSFAYEEDAPVLKNISLNIEPGKSYALVGASGCGKSTLLNLLMASYSNYEGSIHYDDTELREISGESLYELVSIIQQNVFVFNASIRDNITMFCNFPKEEVDRAVQLSGLSELIAEKGEDYLCGENGSGLSGGEKQRISIARSLLRKSSVLFVDEATAALDTKTADMVANAILDLSGMTRVVVTHALEEKQLRRYDSIITLKSGEVIENGSFEDLMSKKGYFYSLYTVSQ